MVEESPPEPLRPGQSREHQHAGVAGRARVFPQPEGHQLAYNLIKGQGESQCSLRERTRHEVDEQWPQKGLQGHNWRNRTQAAFMHVTLYVVEQRSDAALQDKGRGLLGILLLGS